MKNKKGMSELIATVLIIGFTIVVAALVISFGTNLFKKTTEDTDKSVAIASACSDVAMNLKLQTNLISPGTLQVSVTNDGQTKLEGFIFRVYNVGETTAESFDTTTNVASIVTVPAGDYTVAGNGLKTFDITYDAVKIPTPIKVGVKPKVTVSGKVEICGETPKEI